MCCDDVSDNRILGWENSVGPIIWQASDTGLKIYDHNRYILIYNTLNMYAHISVHFITQAIAKTVRNIIKVLNRALMTTKKFI